ncbi:MAG: TPM domain-containing protein [Rubrivivax sp.]
MNLWLRLLMHRWWDQTDARRVLHGDGLDRIQRAIVDSESRHRGEIRVVVEAGLPLSYLLRQSTPRDRAVSLFGKLRVWDTDDNNGVLIYVLLAEHAIEVVADRGLAQKVTAGTWTSMVGTLRDAFRAGRADEGLLGAIQTVDTLLTRHYPRAPGTADTNELPDRPLVL